jgi:hypothetical protein
MFHKKEKQFPITLNEAHDKVILGVVYGWGIWHLLVKLFGK